jgi:hypothetical protein
MLLTFEDRVSESPLVERVWCCRSEHAGHFLSIAANHFEVVFTRYKGTTSVTLRGPDLLAKKRRTGEECWENTPGSRGFNRFHARRGLS